MAVEEQTPSTIKRFSIHEVLGLLAGIGESPGLNFDATALSERCERLVVDVEALIRRSDQKPRVFGALPALVV